MSSNRNLGPIKTLFPETVLFSRNILQVAPKIFVCVLTKGRERAHIRSEKNSVKSTAVRKRSCYYLCFGEFRTCWMIVRLLSQLFCHKFMIFFDDGGVVGGVIFFSFLNNDYLKPVFFNLSQ